MRAAPSPSDLRSMSASHTTGYTKGAIGDRKFKDIAGEIFGRLTVIEHLGHRTGAKTRNHYWRAICECGNIIETKGANLRSGATASCGCLQRELARSAGDRTRKHGMTRTSTYHIWVGMVQRCTNPLAKDFPRYGGAGITVCERWLTFANFLADMGVRPKGKSLDRTNNLLGYSPENCRWATVTQQARNQSTNRILAHSGEAKCVAEWAEQLQMSPVTLLARLGRGWSIERALTTPVDARYNTNGGRGK